MSQEIVVKNEEIVVKQVKTLPVFDVFTGEGWNNHTRVVWNNKTKRLDVASGNRLTAPQLKLVYNRVEEILHHV